MKYYKIQIKLFYPNNRIASTAVGDNIPYIEFYLKKIRSGEIIMNTPLFDSFHLESYDKKKYWEWQLFDVYNLRGAGIHIPGWFVSEDMKNLLENFSLSCPYNFYPCKLLYKNKKIDYFIFQFAGQIIIDIIRTTYINWSNSIFFNPIDESYSSINSMKEFIDESRRVMKTSKYDKEIKLLKLFLKDNIDFFPMGTYLNDDLVSERLKQAIEKMGITGFEFSELDYEVVVEE
jgi:hypothetical protein